VPLKHNNTLYNREREKCSGGEKKKTTLRETGNGRKPDGGDNKIFF